MIRLVIESRGKQPNPEEGRSREAAEAVDKDSRRRAEPGRHRAGEGRGDMIALIASLGGMLFGFGFDLARRMADPSGGVFLCIVGLAMMMWAGFLGDK